MATSGSGFGDELRGIFVPKRGGDEAGWDDSAPPRFWHSDTGRAAGSAGAEGGDASAVGDATAGRWPDTSF